MAANSNLVLQLLITAKDEASALFSTVFSFLDSKASATATAVREAFTGLFGGGLEGAIELESALDAVAAKGGYTSDEMAKLKQEAAQVAAQFGVTGVEAAQGLEILAAAGLSAKDAIATLPQVLALAKSEGVSLDVAAERLADSLAIMGLGFDEAGRMADVLAKGANLSTVSAVQLAESLSTVGGIAKAAGLSLEETVAALDLLAKNGIKGERAGTALQAVLTALQNPASTASQALNALGITSRDLGDVLDGLQGAGAGSETAILAFGETAGPALRALIGEGSAGLEAFTEQLKNADGASQAAAEGMSGNLQSAISSMNAALDTLKQTLVEPLLEPLAKSATALSAAFTEAVQGGAFSGLMDALKMIGTAAGETAETLIKAFDFKAIGSAINTLIVDGINVLGQAMNNLTAIVGGFAAAALIPLGLQLKVAFDATMTFITAQRAAAAAMTATEIVMAGLSRTMAILAGPAGWILAGVAAFALLWESEDKTKAATDALAVSTDEYTKKLKEQTEAQNQVALNKLNDALDEQRQKLADAKAAYDQAAQGGRNFIVVTEDHGAILGKTNKLITDATEIERIRQERLAAVDEQTKILNATEGRRQQIIDELKAKQEAANPATAAATAALGKYQEAVDKAVAAQTAAREELDKLTPGTVDYAIAAFRAQQADEQLKQAKEVLVKAEADYNVELQNLIRGLPVATEETQKGEDAAKKKAEADKNAALALAGINDAIKGYLEASGKVAQIDEDIAASSLRIAKARGDELGIIFEVTKGIEAKAIADGLEEAATLSAVKSLELKKAALIAGAGGYEKLNDSQRIQVGQIDKEIEALGKSKDASKLKEIAQNEEIASSDLAADASVKAARAEEGLAIAKGDAAGAARAKAEAEQQEVVQAEILHDRLLADVDALEAQRNALIDAAGGYEKLTPLQRSQVDALQMQVDAKRNDIAASETSIETQQREADAAERAAGPIGQLIRLYQDKAEAAGREKDAIERSYNGKIRDLQVEQDQAAAKGDSVRVAELAVEIKQAEAEKAQAMADALRVELQAQIALIEAKKLAMTFEEKLTEEGQKKLADMDEQIAKMGDLIDAEQDKADSAKADAEATEKAAKETKKSGDEAEKTTKKVEVLSVAYAKFQGAQATAFGADGIRKYNYIVESIEQAISRANEAAQELGEKGFNGVRTNAFQAAQSAEDMARLLEDSESYLNDAARAAADNLRTALAAARQEAEGLATSLLDMADDFEREMLRIKGDQKKLLELEYQDTLKNMEDIAARAGNIASDEYALAKQRAAELHKLKLQQLADEEKADQTADRVGKAADETERLAAATSRLSQTSLNTLGDQAERLYQNFNKLNGVL